MAKTWKYLAYTSMRTIFGPLKAKRQDGSPYPVEEVEEALSLTRRFLEESGLEENEEITELWVWDKDNEH